MSFLSTRRISAAQFHLNSLGIFCQTPAAIHDMVVVVLGGVNGFTARATE